MSNIYKRPIISADSKAICLHCPHYKPLYLQSPNNYCPSENNCIFITRCMSCHKSTHMSQYWPCVCDWFRWKQPGAIDFSSHTLEFKLQRAEKVPANPILRNIFENYQIITSACHCCYATIFFYSIVERAMVFSWCSYSVIAGTVKDQCIVGYETGVRIKELFSSNSRHKVTHVYVVTVTMNVVY